MESRAIGENLASRVPQPGRVVVIMKADIRDTRMRANKRVLIFRRHEDTLRKEFDADVECDLLEGTAPRKACFVGFNMIAQTKSTY